MPYARNGDLPEGVRNTLPVEAQTVWRTVFNQTEEKHGDESRAAATAWTAVKNGWEKTEDGEWVRKADSFTPPESVQAAAKKGLELRREFGRGGTAVGVARARDLSNGKGISASTIKRMVSYFARHEVDKQGKNWGDDLNPSAGYIAWLLWGGDPGRAWANRIAEELDDVEKIDLGETIIHKNAVQRYTLGVVYEPMAVDTQGDWATAEEIEKACWEFSRMLQGRSQLTKTALELLSAITKALNNGDEVRLDVTDVWDDISKAGGPVNDQHMFDFEGEMPDIVENYIVRADTQIGDEKVVKDSWLMGVVWPEEYYAKIERGERTGFSMEGRGRRVENAPTG